MKIDMCSGAIVCHPLGSSSRCGFRGQSSSSTGHRDRSSFSMPPIIVSSFVSISCSLAFGDVPPKLSAQPLRHAERACEHRCEGSPYHSISIQKILPILTLTGNPQYSCQLPTRRCCQTGGHFNSHFQ